MEENHIVAASKVAPAHRSALRIVAVCAVVAGAVLITAAWWKADPVRDQGAPQSDSHATSGASAVQIQPPFREGMPVPGGESKSAVQPVGSNSGVAAPRLEPPRDLIEAIRRAQAASGKPLPSPAEQSFGHAHRPMSPEDAAKAFEDAVKAAGAVRNQQPDTSAVSPFGPVKN